MNKREHTHAAGPFVLSSNHACPDHVGVRGLATGTAYFIPARVGVWLVW